MAQHVIEMIYRASDPTQHLRHATPVRRRIELKRDVGMGEGGAGRERKNERKNNWKQFHLPRRWPCRCCLCIIIEFCVQSVGADPFDWDREFDTRMKKNGRNVYIFSLFFFFSNSAILPKNHFPYCISCVFCSNTRLATAATAVAVAAGKRRPQDTNTDRRRSNSRKMSNWKWETTCESNI